MSENKKSLLVDYETVKKAKNDNIYMDMILESEDAEKYIQYVIRKFTKAPALFVSNANIEYMDLYQHCLIGLYNGILNMDNEKTVNEKQAYLYWHIVREIQHLMRTGNPNLVKIPQTVRENYSKYETYKKKIIDEKGRIPTIEETMKEFDFSREWAIDLMHGTKNMIPEEQKDENGEIYSIYDLQRDEDSQYDMIHDRLIIEQYKQVLNDKQADSIDMRFIEGCTFDEIGERIGCSPQMAANHVNRAIKLMRMEAMENEMAH